MRPFEVLALTSLSRLFRSGRVGGASVLLVLDLL